jgi:hypothetical protein
MASRVEVAHYKHNEPGRYWLRRSAYRLGRRGHRAGYAASVRLEARGLGDPPPALDLHLDVGHELRPVLAGYVEAHGLELRLQLGIVMGSAGGVEKDRDCRCRRQDIGCGWSPWPNVP